MYRLLVQEMLIFAAVKEFWYERFGYLGMDRADLCVPHRPLGVGLCRDHCRRVLSSLMAKA